MKIQSATNIAQRLVKQFNEDKNDSYATLRGINGPVKLKTRVELGRSETKQMLDAIGKLPRAKQAAVLEALARRVETNGIHFSATALPLVQKLADKLGVEADFKGSARPPMIVG